MGHLAGTNIGPPNPTIAIAPTATISLFSLIIAFGITTIPLKQKETLSYSEKLKRVAANYSIASRIAFQIESTYQKRHCATPCIYNSWVGYSVSYRINFEKSINRKSVHHFACSRIQRVFFGGGPMQDAGFFRASLLFCHFFPYHTQQLCEGK